MFIYDNFFKTMVRKGKTQTMIRKENILSQSVLANIRKNKNITLDTVNRLCNWLHCKPEDIYTYIPDYEADEKNRESD